MPLLSPGTFASTVVGMHPPPCAAALPTSKQATRKTVNNLTLAEGSFSDPALFDHAIVPNAKQANAPQDLATRNRAAALAVNIVTKV